MTRPNETYKIERTCTVCGQSQQIFVTKRQAAFELFDLENALGQTCKNCSAASFTTYFDRPDLDFDLLKEWAINSDLNLMEQDEELLLAHELYLDMILEILDNIPIPDYKRNILMNALCVIVYDNTNGNNSQQGNQLKDRVIEELNNRQDKLEQSDNSIMNYIKDVVYPQLDISIGK